MEGKLGYEPVPLSRLLKELKNLSQLMISLGYCSVFFHDENLYRELEEIDAQIDHIKSLILMQATLATRDRRDAESMISIFDRLWLWIR